MHEKNIRAKHIAVALGLLALLPLPTFGQSAREQIAAEISRLRQTLAALNLSADEAKPGMEGIRRVEESLQSGHLYLSLYRLQVARIEVMATEYAKERLGLEKKGVAAFEDEWQRLGKELAKKEERLNSGSGSQLPLIVRALAETSLSQTQPYYQSGRLYGLNATIPAGLYYMGRAPASLDFAWFCQGLRFPAPGRAPNLRPLDPELGKLEAEILQAYRQPGAAEKQPLFNQANSTLKAASELNQEKRYGGALLQYLEAGRILGLITAAPPERQRLESLRARNDSFRARLADGAADHSIGLLYWEMAQSLLNRPAGGDPNQESLRHAAVILEQALPRYFQYVTEKN